MNDDEKKIIEEEGLYFVEPEDKKKKRVLIIILLLILLLIAIGSASFSVYNYFKIYKHRLNIDTDWDGIADLNVDLDND